MVKKEIKFSDGTRIFYEEVNGITQRFIEYAYSPYEKLQLKKEPYLKELLDKQVRKHNAGKYYYLKILQGIMYGLNDAQRNQLHNELKELHNMVGQEYDISTVRNYIKPTFGKYWRGNEIQCAAFFVTIYLAMLDLEQNKAQYPKSLGKTMVLSSCEAVIIWGKDPIDAATMFEKKKNDIADDYVDWESGSRYEKYNGYNGYDDDTIDEAFDGYPEATWNVD